MISKKDKRWMQLMEVGEAFGCHQMPERSFFMNGYQFPVCARCTGAILAAIIASIVFMKRRLPISVCIALSSVMLFDWGIQYLNIRESTNTRRLVTGLIGGFGYTMLHLHFYCYIYKQIKKLINV